MLNAIQCGACRGHYRRQSLLVSLQPSALATICFAQSCLAKEGWQTWWSMSFGRCLKEVLMVPSLSATFLGFQACMLYLQVLFNYMHIHRNRNMVDPNITFFYGLYDAQERDKVIIW
ncbi:unnamed protein product, partial [Musa textilis]